MTRAYTSNGLNQFTASGATSLGYDTRGNLTTSGSDTYTYSSENLLLTGPGSAALSYDPLLRLYQTSATGFTTTRFAYDGDQMIAEYNSSNALQKRYVFGAGSDAPLVEYDASGTKTYLTADERGSIVVRTNASGVATARNSYDEYGIPGVGNAGRFGYTGQAWLPELGMQYSKARIYSPTLGRFMQTDPIGYGDGMNWYNYVGSDPVNGSDPSGLGDVLVIGSRCPPGATCITDKDDIGRFLSNVAVSDGNGGSTGPDVVVTANQSRPRPTAPTPGGSRIQRFNCFMFRAGGDPMEIIRTGASNVIPGVIGYGVGGAGGRYAERVFRASRLGVGTELGAAAEAGTWGARIGKVPGFFLGLVGGYYATKYVNKLEENICGPG